MKAFKDSNLLITGGTGSFGNAVLKNLLKHEFNQIRIFSRDEKKQDDMRKAYSDSRLKFLIGDIRDKSSVLSAVRDADYVFHAAALKQVPSCEFYPVEAVKTNVLGTENLLDCAIKCKVRKVICLSTDKAVYPINAMGITKALMEKVLISKSREAGDSTVICGTRYGNVMSSRGSVIPLFIKQIRDKKPVTITDPNMTRFIMSLDDAVELVMYAFEHGNSGDIFVQKSPASNILDLAKALIQVLEGDPKLIKNIGIRHGEKLYETLVGVEEMQAAEELKNYYRIPSDQRDLNYEEFFEVGNKKSITHEYNSNNTKQLTISELIPILSNEVSKFIQP